MGTGKYMDKELLIINLIGWLTLNLILTNQKNVWVMTIKIIINTILHPDSK